MTDKPLEWKVTSECTVRAGTNKVEYWVRGNGASYVREDGITFAVPGPYDGTIETAKKRCEEHRMKRMEVEAGS